MLKHAIESTVFGALSLVRSPPQAEQLASKLDSAGVAYTLDPCRTCADPCDLGHEEWPNRFDVDLSSDMLGSVKPYGRQVSFPAILIMRHWAFGTDFGGLG